MACRRGAPSWRGDERKSETGTEDTAQTRREAKLFRPWLPIGGVRVGFCPKKCKRNSSPDAVLPARAVAAKEDYVWPDHRLVDRQRSRRYFTIRCDPNSSRQGTRMLHSSSLRRWLWWYGGVLSVVGLSILIYSPWDPTAREVILALVWLQAGLIAGAVLMGWHVSRQLKPTLEEMTETADSLRQGRFERVLPVPERDAIGRLVDTFNSMSDALATQVARLDADRQELRAVFRCMAEGVVVLDAEQSVRFLNEAASRLLKVPLETSKGRKLWELVRHRALIEAAETILRSDEPYRCELEWHVPVETAVAVQGARLVGEPHRGALLVLHDITNVRQLEHMRRDFVANVSHELKTPLAAIHVMVETLLDGALNDPQHNIRFLERVRENADRLSYLVQDLLTLNRIESGQEALDLRPVPLAAALELCLHQHDVRAQAKQQKLELVPPLGLPVSAWADEDALDHILGNLVDNAIKYTPEGGTITLRWHATGTEAAMEVQDTGMGIPEKDLPRIFERFYRVDKARSRELGGTGLGLSIVKHLAQIMNGRVTAVSELGRGSTFTVHLPRGE
jgi:two-component system, OmpR family, phosphate regulon sensor histidine kinase PhoR